MAENIDIIGQRPGWICVEKPGGISIHNDPGKDLISRLQMDFGQGKKRLQPVHRLDKETSGLVLLATDQDTLARFSAMFAQGKVTKRYKALVHGHFEGPGKNRGIWDTPLTKAAGGRSDPQGRGKRFPAQTRYHVLGQSDHYTLLDIELLTGRKHQIRRHAKLAGHPIVGDPRYGSSRAIEFLRTQRNFSAMGLHAYFLQFKDNNTPITFELKGLPSEVERLMEQDRYTP